MNAGCWKRQYCSRQPHGCIRILVRQFCPYLAYIWQISELTRGISLYIYIYGTRACRQGDFGKNIPSKSPCYQGHLPYIRQIVLSRPSIDHQIVGNRDQLNPTTCSGHEISLTNHETTDRPAQIQRTRHGLLAHILVNSGEYALMSSHISFFFSQFSGSRDKIKEHTCHGTFNRKWII